MKLGLALSGGGIRGIAHAGVIKALEDNGIKIDALGGASSGSMITVLYGMGYSPDDMYKICNKYSKTMIKVNSNVIRKEIKNFILHRKIYSQGINSGEYIERIFTKLASQKGIKEIRDIRKPIVITGVDILTRTKYLFTSCGKNRKNYICDIPIGKAVQSSSSFPIAFSPCRYKDKLFLDGGVLENIPVKEVKKLGVDKVVAVKFDSDKINKDSNVIDILMKVSDIMVEQISKDSLKRSDYILEIPTDGTGILDTSKLDFCYKSGYETTIKHIDSIKSLLKE